MSAHGTAVRALGLVTIAYAAALAWMPIELVRATSAMGQVMSGLASADPATREVIARAGSTPEALADELSAQHRREVLVQVAPALAHALLGAAAGILLVLRRRAGAWLVLAFVLWPVGVWGYHALREALRPVKLDLFTLPLASRVYQIELLGHEWLVEERAFRFWVHATFSALTLAVLAGWFVAPRSKGGRA